MIFNTKLYGEFFDSNPWSRHYSAPHPTSKQSHSVLMYFSHFSLVVGCFSQTFIQLRVFVNDNHQSLTMQYFSKLVSHIYSERLKYNKVHIN